MLVGKKDILSRINLAVLGSDSYSGRHGGRGYEYDGIQLSGTALVQFRHANPLGKVTKMRCSGLRVQGCRKGATSEPDEPNEPKRYGTAT